MLVVRNNETTELCAKKNFIVFNFLPAMFLRGALNVRLGTSNLSVSEAFMEADKRKMPEKGALGLMDMIEVPLNFPSKSFLLPSFSILFILYVCVDFKYISIFDTKERRVCLQYNTFRETCFWETNGLLRFCMLNVESWRSDNVLF